MTSVLTPPEQRVRSGSFPGRQDERPGERSATPTVPQALVWISAAVVLAGVVMGVVGAIRTGISWDEPYHVMRLRNFFEHGWFALDWSVAGDQGSGESNTLVYGPVATLLLHLLGVVTGTEGWGTVGTSPAAYDVRHLGILLIGLVGTGAAAATTRVLLGSWRWALVTAATLLALPMWTGHLMFNVKDVPVATGYTLTTLGLVAMVAPVRGRRWLRVGCLAAGTVLMVGTRPGMASAVAVALVVLAAGIAVSGRFSNRRTALLEVGAGLGASAVVLVAVYPNFFLHPANLVASVRQSASFRDGENAIPGYVPFHVVAQEPLLLLAFFGVGLVTAVGYARAHWRTDTSQVTRLALVSAQLLALPVVAIGKNSDLYNGLRQLLFASPAWAVLVTIGLAKALSWGRENNRWRVVSGVAAAALLLPVLDQVQLFPYQYTYYNAALDATGVHVPSDYWRTSIPELLPRIPTDGQIVCGPTRTGPEDDPGAAVAGRYSMDSSVDCRTDVLGPLAPEWSSRRLSSTDALPADAYYVIIDRDHATPRNCTRLAEVDRTRHLRTLSMTYVARCTETPNLLGSSPVSFVRAPGDQWMSSTLWAYAPRGWVQREDPTALDAAASGAVLAFRTPESCAAAGCSLLMDADAAPGLRADVNGVPARTTVSVGSVAVALPAGTSPGSGAAWITFTSTSPEDFRLRVRTIRVADEATEEESR